ncbi:unnamed protein product [Echinostoma caproni]|uniref:Uncharacterized protein n=1 Tax=Echinostoma caproni TaxID=27848 RepID=A0A183AFT4_9TREM|nr:unnamed protein product [Echinostoma caproni]
MPHDSGEADADALVNSVFAVLLAQLRHGCLTYRNSNQTLQRTTHRLPTFEAKTLVNQSTHRHITIRETQATQDNHTGSTPYHSHGLDLCVRWATGSTVLPNQAGPMDSPLRKTYICATLSGPSGTIMCEHKLPRTDSPNKYRRGRKTRTRNVRSRFTQTLDHNARSCYVCQAAALWAFQRRFLINYGLSTSTATTTGAAMMTTTTTSVNDASVACHSSGSGNRLDDRGKLESEPYRRGHVRLRPRPHSHCDEDDYARITQSNSTAHRFKRRQVVSGNFPEIGAHDSLYNLSFMVNEMATGADRKWNPQVVFCAPRDCSPQRSYFKRDGLRRRPPVGVRESDDLPERRRKSAR